MRIEDTLILTSACIFDDTDVETRRKLTFRGIKTLGLLSKTLVNISFLCILYFFVS